MKKILIILGMLFLPLLVSAQWQLSVKVLLEGALLPTGETMRAELNRPAWPLLAKTFPNKSIPANAVDKIEIELRKSENPALVLTSEPAWLMSDGSIRDFVTGSRSFVSFSGLANGNEYYIGIRHRNHLPIISAQKFRVTAQPITIDFTNPAAIAGGGCQTNTQKACLCAGNISSANNPTEEINAVDWFMLQKAQRKPQSAYAYQIEDLNLDGYVDEKDTPLLQKNNQFLRKVVLP